MGVDRHAVLLAAFVKAEQMLFEFEHAELLVEAAVVFAVETAECVPVCLGLPHVDGDVDAGLVPVAEQPRALVAGMACEELGPWAGGAVRVLERADLRGVDAVAIKNLDHRLLPYYRQAGAHLVAAVRQNATRMAGARPIIRYVNRKERV